MDDWFDMRVDQAHVNRERAKARELRKTNWWQAQLQQGICHYCGQKFKPDELTMDHIVPVARGGKSVKGNVVPCCKECNNRKKYSTPVDMILSGLDGSSDSGLPEAPPREIDIDIPLPDDLSIPEGMTVIEAPEDAPAPHEQ